MNCPKCGKPMECRPHTIEDDKSNESLQLLAQESGTKLPVNVELHTCGSCDYRYVNQVLP